MLHQLLRHYAVTFAKNALKINLYFEAQSAEKYVKIMPARLVILMLIDPL